MDSLFQPIRDNPAVNGPLNMSVRRNSRPTAKVARPAYGLNLKWEAIVPVVVFDGLISTIHTAKFSGWLNEPMLDCFVNGRMGAASVCVSDMGFIGPARHTQEFLVSATDNLGVPTLNAHEPRHASRFAPVHAACASLKTASYKRSMAYAFDARGSECVPVAIRETVPCGMPVLSLMDFCVQPIPISTAIFSDVFMMQTIRTRIEHVNTLSHYSFTNNQGMEFREWLQAEMDAREIGPSDLARTSKVPQPTIFRILSGETKDPRTGTVKKLERALGAESPPLEAPPTEHHELIEAWGYLLPGERQELLKRIKAQAAHNREAANHFKPKVIRVTDMRKRQVHFDGQDNRHQEDDSTNEDSQS